MLLQREDSHEQMIGDLCTWRRVFGRQIDWYQCENDGRSYQEEQEQRTTQS